MKAFWVRLFSLASMAFGLWFISCNIGPDQTRQAFSMQHPEDLIDFDSLAIFLENPQGQPLDTLYRKKPVSEDEFQNLVAPNFEGGVVVIHIRGFKGGSLTLDNQIVYNTESNTIVSNVLSRSPNTRVVLAESVIAVTVGDTFPLPNVKVSPAGLSQTGVTWVSLSPTLLAPTNGPKWVALAPGQASMKATWQGDASIYASLMIQIFNSTPIETGSVGTSLNLLPESLFVNAGASPVNVPRIVGPTGANQAITWFIADSSIAGSVSSQVFGKVAGKTKAIAALVGNASIVDSLWIIVRSTIPEWQMATDTTVRVNLPVLLRPKLKQDYGTVVHFAWDVLGDGVWDDSSTALKDLSLTWTQAGLYPMRLRVRDAEGHVVETTMRIKVVLGPDIRIVSPIDSSWVNTPTVAVSWSINGSIQTDMATEILKQEGLNLITRSARDSAGNRFEVSVRVYLDTTAPAKPLFQNGIVGNTLTPIWKWSSGGGGNGVFRVSLDMPVSAGSPTQPETTYTPNAPLTEGSHALYVQERDAAGNWSASANLGVKLDIIPPTAPEILSKEGTNTRNVRPAFVLHGKGGGMGVFRAKTDDSLFVLADTGKADTNYTPKSDLTEGLHRVYAQERDSAGNWSATTQVQISVDLSAPGAPRISGKTPTNNLKPTWTWVGTSAQGAGIFRFGLDDSILTAKTPVTDTSFMPTTNLSEALHTLYVQERDSAGNWSATSQYPIRVDATGPTKPVVTGTANPTNDLTPTWNWTGDAADGSGSFRFKLDDSALAAATPSTVKTFTPPSSLSAGAHALYVQEIDAAGNWSSLGSYSVTVDTTGPTRPTVTGMASPTNDATPTWNWTGDATNGSGTFRFKLDTLDLSSATTTTVKTFTPAANLAAGTHILYVQEHDGLGNWSASGQFSITIDVTPPAQPVVTGTTTPTNDETPTWNWTGDATSGSGTFRFKLDTATFGANDPTTTVRTVTPATNLGAGAHTLYVQERDAAGNWSTSGTYALTIDLTAPNMPGFTTVFKSPFNDLTPAWTWASGGGGGNGSYRVKVDDANLSTGATTVAVTTYTQPSNLSEGFHTLYIQEMDAAGNGSPVANQAVLVAQRGYAGNSGFANVGTVDKFDIEIHPSGTPYVFYVDSTTELPSVRRLNSSGVWELVGNSGFSPEKCYTGELEMSPSGIPYVVLSIQTGPYIAASLVMRLNTGTNRWESVGNAAIANSYDCELEFGPNGEVFLGYSIDFSADIHVARLNASGGWDDLGGGVVTSQASAYFSMTISPYGVPYVICSSASGINVYKPNPTNTAWMLVGFSSTTRVSSADFASMAVDSSSTLYISSIDPNTSSQVSVSSCLLGAASWNLVGQAGFIGQSGVKSSIAIAPNGTPHVIGSDGPATIYRRNAAAPSGWETVGPANMLGSNIGGSKIAITPAGVPYILVQDPTQGNRISVLRASFD